MYIVIYRLHGVDIRCSDSAPVYIKDADKAIINPADGSVNYLTDGNSYVTDDGEPNVVLFSNSDLTISGEGGTLKKTFTLSGKVTSVSF